MELRREVLKKNFKGQTIEGGKKIITIVTVIVIKTIENFLGNNIC